MPRKVLRDVVGYWREHFDWRASERRLNGLPQFTIEIDGRIVHYVHVKGADPESVPLVLTHGWPGSFVEMYKIIPMLADPSNNGLTGYRSFDVIVPSLPGFGFSQAPVSATLRMYRENARQPLRFGFGERITPPLSYARFPKEIVNPPREWIGRVSNVIRWTEMPVGGHFAALEQPRALANDIHEAFSVFR
jgi:pimeloyl-ACP methyl ester carboxylesterase